MVTLLASRHDAAVARSASARRHRLRAHRMILDDPATDEPFTEEKLRMAAAWFENIFELRLKEGVTIFMPAIRISDEDIRK
jgi:hypothetical protein